ncbi:MAG: peptidyl-prolyl cis-trans isomerase [Candidatus Omnitrophica bacterium]|nr:peptidyl-prolyl cis-trans isomerase [Candidatus Omnitrophota bacterium]MDD5591811.1 peptidyl-prolyl cis-trans isomerase [Candidatus Omnitrophota bacterium]
MDKIKNQGLKGLKISLFLLFSIAYSLQLTAYNLHAEDKIVAIVNNDVITQKDLDDFVNFTRVQLMGEFKGRSLESKMQSIKLDLMDKLIEDRIILQEAKKSNIRIDESRIKARIDDIRRRYDSEKDFQTSLAKQGLVQADLESKIRDQLLMYTIIEIKIKSKILVNPAEVTDFYQQNIDKFKLPEQREFESINTGEEDLASKVFNDLRNGQEFQDVASKYFLAVNKMSGAGNGQLRKDIEEKIFRLKVGEISAPVKIEEQYYIFKLDNIIPPRQQSISGAQGDIYTFLFDQKMQEALATWLDELKKQSYIKIMQD